MHPGLCALTPLPMAEPRSPVPVLLVTAVFSRHADALSLARMQLEQAYGPVEKVSPLFVFDQTAYYADKMGGDLRKQFFAFHDLMAPERLPDVKLHTNALERETAQSGRYLEARPINIDPGYLQLGKFLLATTKDQGHRIYLRNGIYAEVTLSLYGRSVRAVAVDLRRLSSARRPCLSARGPRVLSRPTVRRPAGSIHHPLTTEPATSKPTSAKEIAAVASLERYPEQFRRVLLGATIALLTARMLRLAKILACCKSRPDRLISLSRFSGC